MEETQPVKYDFTGLDESVEAVADNPEEAVIEEEEVAPVQEEEVEEEVSEQDTLEEEPDTTEAVQQEVKVYTPEEIETILQDGDFDKIDTSRLSDEGKLVMKSFQKGLTPKLQERSELKRELEQLRQSVEELKPKPEPADIFEAYDQSPTEVLSYIDQQIVQLATEGKAENIGQIEGLRTLKEQFRFREEAKLREQQTSQQQIQTVMAELTKEVPDIIEKQGKLKDFAINVLNYSEQELAQLTDPNTQGMKAVMEIARINRAYETVNARTTIKSKVKKKAPVQVEKPGNGFDTSNDVDHSDIRKEALKTGDWRSVFLDLGDD